MRALAITAEAFRKPAPLTVMEERRQSYENRPHMTSAPRRDELFYAGCFPYEHSTIGDMARPARRDARRGARLPARYYAPDNAVIVITGDFRPAAAMRYGPPATSAPYHRPPPRPWSDPGFTPGRGRGVHRR